MKPRLVHVLENEAGEPVMSAIDPRRVKAGRVGGVRVVPYVPASEWLDGPPPGAGEFWICWFTDNEGWRVDLVSVGPAVINPGGRLLLKLLRSVAYDFEANRYRISHHMRPSPEPRVPVPLDTPGPIAP